VLAVQAYGDPAMRAYGDLDLLFASGTFAGHGIDERRWYEAAVRSAPSMAENPGRISFSIRN